MRTNRIALALVLAAAVGRSAGAQRGGMGGRGMMGMPRDSVTGAQLGVVHELMMSHDKIRRTVTNLGNGIRTVTESDDPRLAGLIRKHTIEMTARVAAGDDPALPMESAALRMIFRNKDLIRTRVDTSASGIVVEQTSSDSQTVAALQQHAAEVSALAKDGMAAMRRAMMQVPAKSHRPPPATSDAP
jgi:hypothetical protein